VVLSAVPEGVRERAEIRKQAHPACYLCGTQGQPLYNRMRDVLFGVPGEWNINRCPNPGCGLLWLDPMPVEEDLIRLYESYYTHEAPPIREAQPGAIARMYDFVKAAYLSEHFGRADLERSDVPRLRPGLMRKIASLPAYGHPAFQARIKFPIGALGRKVRGRLLDVGCGNGELLSLAQKMGWKAEGIDFDATAVDAARRRGLTVHLGDLREGTFADHAFDLVMSSHVLEHVPDPVALLRQCRRLLRPGGTVLAVTPNAESWGHAVFGRNWRGLEAPRHLHIFSPGSLGRAARSAGFQLVTIASLARIVPYIFEIGRQLESEQRAAGGTRQRFSPVGRLGGRSALLVELLLLKWRPTLGEELFLEATC